MTDSTRQQFLEAAKQLFADRGFYGASLANIASELGLTKQALLHHFKSKEKLYGEILQGISDNMLESIDRVRLQQQGSRQQLEALLLDFHRTSLEHPNDTRIIMRELLDVETRPGDVHNWYLKPFLDNLADMIGQLSPRKVVDSSEALSLVYPILGAINYLSISRKVIEEMYGPAHYEHMTRRFPDYIRAQVQRLVNELGGTEDR